MIQVSDSKDELDRSSGVCAPSLIVTHIDNSSEKEEEGMSLNKKRGLRELLVDRAKGLAPKDTLGSQPPFPFSPPPPPVVNLFALANLKKRKKEKEVAKERELVPQNEGVPPKQQKTAKGRGWASSVKSRED